MKPGSLETFGKYLLLKKLAAGGMAEVFLARPASSDANGRVLVIKRVLPNVADDPTFVSMFRGEIQVIMGFNHPHTVQLHDFGEVDLQPYIAMEYIEGKNLKQIVNKFIEKKEKIPIPMVLSLMAQAASGLNYAHSFENKVTGESLHAIHRDITPHNLIVSYDGNLKVIDFGIAKAKGELAERTRTGIIKGKVGYLSPEQIEGKEADERSDIFSLGVVAWELVTLKRPFSRPGDTDQNILERIQDCEGYLIPPSFVDPEIPKEIDRVIMHCLRKNPNERYPTASEFQRALRSCLLKYYPSYSYSDTAQITQALFENEMSSERKELREINDAAQILLSNSGYLKGAEKDSTRTMVEMVNSLRDALPNLPKSGDGIGAMLEKRAVKRNRIRSFALLSFYLVSIIGGIKLNQKYLFLDKIGIPMTPAPIKAAAVSPVQNRVPASQPIYLKRTTSNR